MSPWTVACQAPLPVGFSRQEYWSGLPFPSPKDLFDPGIEPKSPVLYVDSFPSELPGKPPDVAYRPGIIKIGSILKWEGFKSLCFATRESIAMRSPHPQKAGLALNPS